MDLKTRALKLREQSDDATAEASARWDDFEQKREAVKALGEDVDVTGTDELAAAEAAHPPYREAAEKARTAKEAYMAVLDLMDTDVPQGAPQGRARYPLGQEA